MIIQFDLRGSVARHKGIFDTTGFWVKYGIDCDDVTKEVTAFKLWSHFSFTYESRDSDKTDAVLNALAGIIDGTHWNWEDPEIGFLKVLRRL